jgi:hypothetical protein
MALSEEQQIGMHSSYIDNILTKENGRFFTTMEVIERCKQASWSKFDCIHSALDSLLKRGLIEKDATYGYCKKGLSAALRREMNSGSPKMPRADFDKLLPPQQAEYCRNGGRVV